MPASGTGAALPDSVANAKVQEHKDEELNRLIEKKYAGNPAEKDAVLRDVAKLNALGDVAKEQAEFYRRTMVTPAPVDFKPEPTARKIRLRIVVEKSKIRLGGYPRFRLEMTNVGRDTIDYEEYRSSLFVKDAGSEDSTVMRLYITDPRGNRENAIGDRWVDETSPSSTSNEMRYLPDSMPKADKAKWFAETAARSRASTHFQVRLMPGETLHSIGDDASPRENFRTLRTEHHYDMPGTYQLQAELDDRPEPLDEYFIEANLRSGSTLEEIHKDHDRWMNDALGPVSSNVVSYEVVR